MRFAVALCISLALLSAIVYAESKKPADYPLRIHIFNRSEMNFLHNRAVEETKGDGRANLFENSEPHAVDFTFDCDQKLRVSFGYETYMAKWKKPGQELVLLIPVFGKTGAFFTCNLKTDVQDFAYATRDSKMTKEPADAYKKWMVNHDYDPEHGKDMPKNLARDQQPAATPQKP